MSYKTKMPSTIEFGTDLLFLPQLESLGLFTALSKHCMPHLNLEVGDWVNLGDELVRMDLTFFKYEETPKWFHFKEDELVTTSISIPSPVSGLVVGFRYDLVAYHSKYAMGRTSLVYGNEHKTWPIILMPKHQGI